MKERNEPIEKHTNTVVNTSIAKIKNPNSRNKKLANQKKDPEEDIPIAAIKRKYNCKLN